METEMNLKYKVKVPLKARIKELIYISTNINNLVSRKIRMTLLI